MIAEGEEGERRLIDLLALPQVKTLVRSKIFTMSLRENAGTVTPSNALPLPLITFRGCKLILWRTSSVKMQRKLRQSITDVTLKHERSCILALK